jgi:hypothetical protein
VTRESTGGGHRSRAGRRTATTGTIIWRWTRIKGEGKGYCEGNMGSNKYRPDDATYPKNCVIKGSNTRAYRGSQPAETVSLTCQ